MKIALLLFGMSYCEYTHWYSKKKLKINYMNSYDNYQNYIYKYFYDKGYDIDVYFTTNILSDEEKNNLIKKYKPVKYSFIKNKKNKILSRNEKLVNVIELCLNNNIKYDLVLVTRFDLFFNKDFSKSNIILEKFNLVSVLENNNLICDNFYLFPFYLLEKFYIIVKKNFKISHHLIKKDLEKINGTAYINYILNEKKIINQLTFYKIVRNYIN